MAADPDAARYASGTRAQAIAALATVRASRPTVRTTTSSTVIRSVMAGITGDG